MKIIVMGTGPFAVPTFRWLLQSDHEVPLLVTRPISDAGKRRKSAANPMRDCGVQEGVEIADPASVNEPGFIEQLQSHRADLLLVCDYGQILSRNVLAIANKGGINLHGSLLPKYRGAAPIQWALYNGDPLTGVTVIHMTARLDAGPSLVQRETEIGPRETAVQLEPRLAILGVDAVRQAIEILEDWDGQQSIGEVQDKSLATKAPQLKKQQGNIDWSQSARQIFNQIRAFQPWPGSFTNWLAAGGKPLRLIIHAADCAADPESNPADLQPGRIQAVDDQSIAVCTGAGLLLIRQIQPAGKKPMPVAEFLRGRQLKPGDRLGGE